MTTEQEIVKRVHEFMKARRGHVWFNVNPRYNGGSPAMVNFGTAVRVAIGEQEAHEDCLSGIFGEELRDKAERQGLKGIAEATREGPKKRGWDVLDLITLERYDRPYSTP